MDKPDLGEDPRFADEEARADHREELLDVLQEWVLTFDSVEELEAALDKGRLVLGVIRTITEAAATDWAKERGAIVKISDRKDGEISVPNTPWRFSQAPSGVRGEVAHRGQHNREVLRELLAMTDEELEKLEANDILSSRLPKT